ncbi:DUF1501 domain-containing protein [Luteolibacter flavescens]|uniref:DUF1501 domain-containing protein n=1 Tax=Luteolibacter flavescens TaxID=1859460 RepID=A0ABT3FMY9_9BACT|nr:DUF1501 domain-containing protein [Luteolibacter flavescens]MCW1884350.1 DUF1501 domain-containing protein [Luteolibacter flavescens]
MNRRKFLGEASCAAIGSTSVLSTLLNLTMANHAAAQGGFGTQRKTLVCVFMSGGCDTFNLLIPRGAGYGEYAAARSNLAIPEAQLRTLNGTNFGLHPSCTRLAEMFNGTGTGVMAGKKRVSMLANVGSLIEPIPNKAAYLNGSVSIPKALFSHRDQIEQWQTSVPQGMQVLSGWGGRAADVIHSTYNTEQTGGFYMPMNYSVAGNSAFQIGQSEGQFVITGGGALAFSGSTGDSAVLKAKKQIIEQTVSGPLEEHYSNLFHRTHGRITANSMARGQEFQQNFSSPGTLNGQNVNTVVANAPFPNHWISSQFRAAVKTIAIRQQLKLMRQTMFIDFGGWDHHAELLQNHGSMLAVLDGALYAFQYCLETLGLANDVITFTASDFGRTLRSNGQGTDHAWSSNQIVMGGPVAGGQVRGSFPSLVIEGADDIGRGGRIFPKLSADEYFCELLRWFGVTAGDMDMVLPNIGNFYDPRSSSNPVGFLA